MYRRHREVGKIGTDAVKTIRWALFPLQFAGTLQDRLTGYIEVACEGGAVNQTVVTITNTGAGARTSVSGEGEGA